MRLPVEGDRDSKAGLESNGQGSGLSKAGTGHCMAKRVRIRAAAAPVTVACHSIQDCQGRTHFCTSWCRSPPQSLKHPRPAASLIVIPVFVPLRCDMAIVIRKSLRPLRTAGNRMKQT